jgi:hypothetical protein
MSKTITEAGLKVYILNSPNMTLNEALNTYSSECIKAIDLVAS